MKISFHGAAQEVTGSCNLLEVKGGNILIDCGMFQGDEENEEKNFDQFGFDPSKLEAVIVTHAHLDHVGRLPLLIGGGFEGPLYATEATMELARLILEDAFSVMNYEYRKKGKPILYNIDQVEKTLGQFVTVEYEKKTTLVKSGASFTLHDAGHIFGAAFVEIEAEGKKIIFSGDVGNTDVPILKNTTALPSEADLVVCESTYGGRIHEAKSNEEREMLIENMLNNALARGGVVMIPSFALERTQQFLYILNDLVDRKKSLAKVPIFLDSPLAIHATEVYRRFPRYYNMEAAKLYKADDDLFQFPGLTMTTTRDESKQINTKQGSKIIIAGAGMMNGGRIIHHAKRYLSNPNSTLFFVGYQAHGTLGRRIRDGEKNVKIMGDNIPVRCHIEAIGALSAHADQEKILDWLGGSSVLPKKVIFNHGESDQSNIVAEKVEKELGIEVGVAEIGRVVEV